MRPSGSPLLNPSGLVDQRLQPMWEQIEQVRLLLPQIAHVSYYMESIFNLDRNLTLLTDENVDHNILQDIQIFQGANAYEIAVAEGFVGSVSTWLTSLIGPQGDTGLLDEVAHAVLTDGIAANAAAALAAQNTANTAISTFSDYTPKATYDARVAYVDGVLANLNTTINDAIIPLLPVVRTDLEITTLANAAINNALLVVNSAINVLDGRVDLHSIDLGNLSSDLSDVSTAFGSFLIDNGDTLSRIDVLEASSSSYNTSIVSLQTVSADYAADITVLQASSATSNSQILALQAVDATTATQINNLQVSNNTNFASIESLETVTVDGLAAAALDRTTIRAEFATADDDVLTSATALVEDETTARTTALEAAATDRTLIRSQFAAADSGVLSSASALVSAETSARTTAISAAATDRASIRAEFATADNGVLTAATALVSSEASARSDADGAAAALITTLTANISGRGALNGNAFFDEGPASTEVVPPRWTNWANGITVAAVEAKPWGGSGLHAKMNPLAGTPTNVGWRTDPGQGSARGSTQYLLRANIARGTGSLTSSGVYLVWYNAADASVGSTTIKFATDADTSGVISAVGDGRRVFEQLVTSPATATKFVMYAMAAWSGFGQAAQATTATIRWFECSLNPTDSATAQVTIAASAIADVDGRVAAKYGLTLDVDGRVSGFTSENDGAVASFEILADVFSISAPGGGARTEFSDGNWRIYDSSGMLRVRMGVW